MRIFKGMAWNLNSRPLCKELDDAYFDTVVFERLKQPFRHAPVLPAYRLEFREDHERGSAPESEWFRADSDEDALRRIMQILGLTKLTKKRFRAAGAKRLMYGEKQIYPTQDNKKKH